jgi:hypothetical protein
MNQFTLNNVTSKFLRVNPSTEERNGNTVLAVFLKIKVLANNSILDRFSPDLKPFFYKEDADPTQGNLLSDEEREKGAHLTVLRNPEIQSFEWKYEAEEYVFTCDYGIGGDSNIKLSEVKIKVSHITPQEGGTVAVIFSVSALCDGETIGKLSELIQGEVKISLAPATEQEQLALQQKKEDQKAALEHHFTGNDQDPDDVVDVGNPSDFEEKEAAEKAGMSVD